MKKNYSRCITALAMLIFSFSSQSAGAQIPGAGLVTGIIKKVITAIDLKVQELQNRTIALQNAEQEVINHLSLGQLSDISGWLNKEQRLYQGYYQELSSVKTIISGYREVKDAIRAQAQLVAEYHSASKQFHHDPHFSASELQYIETIYSGILEESFRNLDRLKVAVEAFSTQMDDAERLAAIHRASSGIQMNLDHLRQFGSQAIALSLARTRDEQDRATIKSLYGIR